MLHTIRSIIVILFLFLSPTALASVSLEVKVLLQGAYDHGSGLMRDDLRSKHYLPTMQPYGMQPFDYAGSEVLTEQVMSQSGNTAVVDWVLLELRDVSDNSLLHAQKAVALRRDGVLIDPVNGDSDIVFKNVQPGSYQVGVQHRNHLGVTSATVFVLEAETAAVADFTDNTLSVVGENARYIDTTTNLAMLWAGDADASRKMIASGPDTDSNILLANILTEAANSDLSANYRLAGYLSTDLNLDGITLFAGPGNDVNILRSNILTHPKNTTLSSNYVVQGHMPGLRRLASAVHTGNARLAGKDETLLDAAIAELNILKQTPELLSTLYGNEAIIYNPGNRTQLINLDGWIEGMYPILTGNKGNVLGMAGESESSRYAAFASIPTEYFDQGENLTFQEPFKRLMEWLIQFDDRALPANPTLALSFAGGDKDEFIAWIADYMPDWTVVACDNVAELGGCYAGVDLIVTGWQADNDAAQAVRQILEAEMSAGKPLLYLHTWYEAYNDVADAIAGLLHFSLSYGGNFWAKDAADWTDAQTMQDTAWAQQGLGGVEIMLDHFKAEDYSFDWSGCTGNCLETEGYTEDFVNGAEKVRSMMTALDKAKIDIFKEQAGARWVKLLALLGDQYRQQVSFPMDKASSNTPVFLKSLLADHATYNYRNINPVQADMGNFSRSDFSHITPVTRTIALNSKRNFRAAGVYALPGQTFRVTRNDDSELDTAIYINTQRPASTHEFENNGYKRPKFLKSPAINIAPGETIKMTSPYGGPIQISFSVNDLPVEFTFENIGEHPFWNGTEDDAVFSQQLEQGDYDWAELVTPGFEVHSTLLKMRESMSDTKWGSAQSLAAATIRYVHNFPHVLAGFKGPGVDVVAEIHDFATEHGYTIDNLDLVKHMNADQATCGYGCSGNPYDAYWAFSPVGHGDIHELGHGLEKSKMRFAGWERHTTTNHYSYYTKSQYFKETGADPVCQNLPFESMFTILNEAVNQAEPAAYIKAELWDKMGWSQGAGMTIQMMMAAQDNGSLIDGWHLLARLHIMEREFQRAIDTEADWNEQRDSLGFGQFTLTDAKALSNNDWLLIAVSHATQHDHRDYFDMWALDYTPEAAAQIASENHPLVARNYFVSTANGYCKGEGFDGQKLLVDGTQTWPE